MPNQALHLPPVPSTVMAVRMPNQAKSAIGNQGTFSADSDALLDSAAIPAADTFHLIAEGSAILQRLDENSPTFWADFRRGTEILALIGDGPSVPQSEAERQLQEVERRYADVLKAHDETGAPLPAPNGQPSKLNRRQWLQVRTPAFKNWFGDWESSSKAAILNGPSLATLTTENVPEGGYKEIEAWAAGIFQQQGGIASRRHQ